MPKKPGIYSVVPHVPQKRLADRNPYPGPVVGSVNPTTVPKRAPRIAGFASKHGYGHPPHLQMGHLRLSGHKQAHQVGKMPKKLKEPS